MTKLFRQQENRSPGVGVRISITGPCGGPVNLEDHHLSGIIIITMPYTVSSMGIIHMTKMRKRRKSKWR